MFNFNGTTSVVSWGDLAIFDTMTAGTWLFWLEYDTVATDGFLSKGAASAAGQGWRIGTGTGSNNDLSFRIANQSGRFVGAFPDTTLHHWGFVFDGAGTGNAGRLQGYKDGVQRPLTYSGTIPVDTGADNATAVLAMQEAATFADGRMAGVKMWNVPLTNVQVFEEYNSWRPVFYTGLQIWAPFDDSLTAPSDYSSHRRTATGTALGRAVAQPVSYGG